MKHQARWLVTGYDLNCDLRQFFVRALNVANARYVGLALVDFITNIRLIEEE